LPHAGVVLLFNKEIILSFFQLPSLVHILDLAHGLQIYFITPNHLFKSRKIPPPAEMAENNPPLELANRDHPNLTPTLISLAFYAIPILTIQHLLASQCTPLASRLNVFLAGFFLLFLAHLIHAYLHLHYIRPVIISRSGMEGGCIGGVLL
jgi:hypothetical protein